MTVHGNSAAAHAEGLRAGARKGLWRKLTARVGLNPQAARADAEAARWDHGAAAEKLTARLLAPLAAKGWHIRHDLALPGSRANVDHILIPPGADGVIVLDTKAWHRGRRTRVARGRVHCGEQDRHGQVEKVAGYAARVQAALGDGVQVEPLLVVHGSRVAGGHLDVGVKGWPGPVYVLAPDWLVSTLEAVATRSAPDPRAADALAARVDALLPRYRE
ncbi:nuclease-related domain-containing protein [Streptomyces sp. NPDC059524]|uniref:nuclease-related domain-containing protein n=1 Tax=Streptomyces sp. NPDC059524 TaxID=3346856 RepID=UPI0036A6CD15